VVKNYAGAPLFETPSSTVHDSSRRCRRSGVFLT
jgi:hypothetical protein